MCKKIKFGIRHNRGISTCTLIIAFFCTENLTMFVIQLKMFLLCVVMAVLLGTAHSQCTQLPTEQQIQISLLSIINSNLGEGQVPGTVTLLSHHYTCIAPGENINEISQISVAVVFNFTTTGGATDTRQLQIQLKCQNTNYYGATIAEQSPPAVAFNLTTREDCFACVPSGPPNITIDTDSNCAGMCVKLCMYMYILK